jgi:hypothetical protein
MHSKAMQRCGSPFEADPAHFATHVGGGRKAGCETNQTNRAGTREGPRSFDEAPGPFLLALARVADLEPKFYLALPAPAFGQPARHALTA